MLFRILLALISLMTLAPDWGLSQNPVKIKRVVIDPGHGGHDPGTISTNRRFLEKNIALSVALKLGEAISREYPGIDIVYTRKTDRFIPLNQRSEIANKCKADLFISIHVNGVSAKSASGSETFVMGPDRSNSNLEVSMLENSVIKLEGDDYESKYEGFDPNNPESYIIFSLLQNAHLEQSLTFASLIQKHSAAGPIRVNRGIKQAEFLVLWKTTMPSVLVELGFISNASDLSVLSQEKNHEIFAQNIFRAFREYREMYEGDSPSLNREDISRNGVTDSLSEPEQKVKEVNNVNQEEKAIYKIQIMAVAKYLDPSSAFFRGEKGVTHYKAGNMYKYMIGEFFSAPEAEKELERLRKKFNGAFIVKFEKGVPSPYYK